MVMKRLAVVMGATRGQGGSVVNALLATNQFAIRGVTPDATTPGADRLRERGIEVLEVDPDKTEALARAFDSAHVIFAVTTMQDGNMEREVAQGRNIADAAATVKTLGHFVWSTLPSASAVSGGKIPVKHMDGKARVDEYILGSLPKLAQMTTFYWGGFYAENVTYPPYVPNLVPSIGKHVWVQPVKPDTLVPMVGDHNVNTGLFVRRILQRPQLSLPARYVLGVVDWATHGHMLSLWAKLLGEKNGEPIDPVYITSDVKTVGQLWPGVGEELGQMLKLSEVFEKEAWTKQDEAVLTAVDLDLKTGDKEGELVSTHVAIQRLSSSLEL